MNFGKRLRDLRKNKDLNQTDLAKVFDVSQSTIANYELGNKEPSHDMLLKLADFFNVSLDYLLGQTNDPRPIDQVNEENKQRISKALKDEEPELVEFWQELKEREDLFLLFKQARELDDDDIKRIIRIIKVIEDEEEAGHTHG
jgi:transcriptional regulator with XRE-family HTH domain